MQYLYRLLRHKILNGLKWISHPITVFVSLQIVWLTTTVLWVIWFLNQKKMLNSLLGSHDLAVNDSSFSIVFLSLGCALLLVALLGTVQLFLFSLKQKSLLKQQKSFVSSVTHELRSPLASLQLAFETMKERELSGDVKRNIHLMVERDLERLVHLVDRILISARLDKGIIDFQSQKETIHMAGIVQKAQDQAAYLDQNLSTRIRVNCPNALKIKGVKLALSLILGNLLENAIKYSPKGSPIFIDVRPDGNNLLLRVRDRGYGLSKNEYRKIFKMFHRSPVASTKAVAGTGLGLFIVKWTTRVLGGKVWVHSKGVGLGSTFSVSLPVEFVNT